MTETSASRDRDVDNLSRDETLVRLEYIETETTTLDVPAHYCYYNYFLKAYPANSQASTQTLTRREHNGL